MQVVFSSEKTMYEKVIPDEVSVSRSVTSSVLLCFAQNGHLRYPASRFILTNDSEEINFSHSISSEYAPYIKVLYL